MPDQNAVLAGLARDDLFTVVFEQVMTDTARFADLLLPATTFLEQWEIKQSYGSYVVGGIRPAVARRGEARPNVEVFAALGRAMGFTDAPFGWDEETAFREVAEHLTFAGRPVDADAAHRRALGSAPTSPARRRCSSAPSTRRPRTARSTWRRPASAPTPFVYHRLNGDGRFPLALISPGSHRMITSSMGEYNFDRLTVTLHPDDAAARGIASGGAVRVWNERGEVALPGAASPTACAPASR